MEFTLVILHIVYTVQKLKDARDIDAKLSRRVLRNSQDIHAIKYNVARISGTDLPKLREQQDAHEKRTATLESTSKSQQDAVTKLQTDLASTNRSVNDVARIASSSLAKVNALGAQFDEASATIEDAASFLETQFRTITDELTNLNVRASNVDSSLASLQAADAAQSAIIDVPSKKVTASSLCLDAECISAAQLKEISATIALQNKLNPPPPVAPPTPPPLTPPTL
jgi:chaperonin cofactor prefoldin